MTAELFELVDVLNGSFLHRRLEHIGTQQQVEANLCGQPRDLPRSLHELVHLGGVDFRRLDLAAARL